MRTLNFQLAVALFVFLALGSIGQGSRGESRAPSGADLEPQAQVAELTPVASARAPLSIGGDMALATESTACVIESYDNRVHCIARDGGRPAVFGRRGQGPGEFPSEPSSIVRGPDGTIGVVAIVRRRTNRRGTGYSMSGCRAGSSHPRRSTPSFRAKTSTGQGKHGRTGTWTSMCRPETSSGRGYSPMTWPQGPDAGCRR